MPDLDKLVTILKESQLADKVVSSRKIGFPLDSDAMGSSFLIDDFMYSVIPTENWFMEGTNKTMPTNVIGGRLQVDDSGDGIRIHVCKTKNVSLPVNSPNQVVVRIRQKQVLNNLNTHQVLGLINDLPASNPLVNTVDGVFFRASNGAGAVNWTCVCRAFNVETNQASAVLCDLNVDHSFEIQVINNSAQFFIDGLLQATINTNVPSALLRLATITIGRSAGTFGFQLDSAMIWNARL